MNRNEAIELLKKYNLNVKIYKLINEQLVEL